MSSRTARATQRNPVWKKTKKTKKIKNKKQTPQNKIKKIYFSHMIHCCCLQTHQKRASDPITDGCEPPCGCWKLNSGPLAEQSVLLTAEPSLQPQITNLLEIFSTDACLQVQRINLITTAPLPVNIMPAGSEQHLLPRMFRQI